VFLGTEPALRVGMKLAAAVRYLNAKKKRSFPVKIGLDEE
jgi:hypothetical protein